jgi:hypothetical protein
MLLCKILLEMYHMDSNDRKVHMRRRVVLPVSPKKGARAGFTIAEVLLSLAIVAGAMGTFVSLGIMSLRRMKTGTDYYAASLIARNQLERIRLMHFDAAAAVSEPQHRVDTDGNASSSGSFTREITVTKLSDDLISIMGKIHFPSRHGEISAKPFVVETCYARSVHE